MVRLKQNWVLREENTPFFFKGICICAVGTGGFWEDLSDQLLLQCPPKLLQALFTLLDHQ